MAGANQKAMPRSPQPTLTRAPLGVQRDDLVDQADVGKAAALRLAHDLGVAALVCVLRVQCVRVCWRRRSERTTTTTPAQPKPDQCNASMRAASAMQHLRGTR
jgi:hypothetical protein